MTKQQKQFGRRYAGVIPMIAGAIWNGYEMTHNMEFIRGLMSHHIDMVALLHSAASLSLIGLWQIYLTLQRVHDNSGLINL